MKRIGTSTAFPSTMQRDRKREGLRVCRAAWLVGVTVREYRELEAGDRVPEFEVWDRWGHILKGMAGTTTRRHGRHR